MDKYNTNNDDYYCYQNSIVLRNKLNITEENIFEQAEREITKRSIDDIHYAEPPYKLAYLQNIHKILFSNLYEWAGNIRTVDISKGNTRFCTIDRIIPETKKIFGKLEQENYLSLYSNFDILTKKFAQYYGDLNMIHPFREGNGRVQRILFEHIALYNGYNLNWSKVKSQKEWKQANIDSVFVENERLESIFNDILVQIHHLI